jgi:PAS domain S-box-containing protein
MPDPIDRGRRRSPVDAWQTAVSGIDADAWLQRFRKSSRPHETPEDALAFYTRIFFEAPVAILILTKEYVVADANLAAEQLLKRPVDVLRGKPFQRNVAKSDRRAFTGISAVITGEESRITRPLRLVNAEGNETEAALIASALRDDKGEPEFIMMMFFERGEKVTSDIL